MEKPLRTQCQTCFHSTLNLLFSIMVKLEAKSLMREGGVATTVINIYEVAYGVNRGMSSPGRRISEFEKLVSNLDVFNLDYRAAIKAAEISGNLEGGYSIDPFDSLIAAIIMVNGGECIVTRNTSHFEKIKELKTEAH